MAIRINAASSPNIGISKKIYQNSVQRSQMGTYKFSETITFCIVLYSAHLKKILHTGDHLISWRVLKIAPIPKNKSNKEEEDKEEEEDEEEE